MVTAKCRTPLSGADASRSPLPALVLPAMFRSMLVIDTQDQSCTAHSLDSWSRNSTFTGTRQRGGSWPYFDTYSLFSRVPLEYAGEALHSLRGKLDMSLLNTSRIFVLKSKVDLKKHVPVANWHFDPKCFLKAAASPISLGARALQLLPTMAAATMLVLCMGVTNAVTGRLPPVKNAYTRKCPSRIVPLLYSPVAGPPKNCVEINAHFSGGTVGRATATS